MENKGGCIVENSKTNQMPKFFLKQKKNGSIGSKLFESQKLLSPHVLVSFI